MSEPGPTTEEKGTLTSWIYKLKDEELRTVARSYQLPEVGTVQDLRARIAGFIKSKKNVRPGQTPMEDATPQTKMAESCNVIRKWGVKFDGTSDPISFLERIDELKTCYKIEEVGILTSLPELLKDKALLWFRNNKAEWNSWDQFTTSFQKRFMPPRPRFWLEEEIRRRTQGDQERVVDYVTDIQTLLRRSGNTEPDTQLERIYENLRTEYKLYVRRRDFKSLSELVTLAEEFEALQVENSTCRSPPTPSEAYAAETAYNPSRWKKKPPGKTPPISSITAPKEPNRRPEPKGNQYVREDRCWRCGQRGHFRQQCQGPRKLFCSYCGKDGVFTRDCLCRRPGNAIARREEGGSPV